jgi:hypothetical protein
VADPKKIRLTFLWSDEAAVVQDFNKGHSEKMVKWADAFFGQYGMKLDVYPPPGGSAKEAYQYCLAKSNGFDPDVRTAEELEIAITTEKRPTALKYLPLWIFFRDTDQDAVALSKIAALDSLQAQIRALPQHHPDRLDLEARFEVLFDAFLIWTRDVAEKRKEFQRLDDILTGINNKYLEQRQRVDTDTPFRLQIGEKMLLATAQRIAGLRTAANAAIVDEYRLKIIHCRFGTVPEKMLTWERQNYLGVHRGGIGFNRLAGKFIFNGSMILINTNRHEDITLAHEIMHTTGRGHPLEPQWVDMRAAVRKITQDPATGKYVFPPLIEFVNAGHKDGEPNDILNYNSIGKKPTEVIMTDDDKERLEWQPFVRPPPGSP